MAIIGIDLGTTNSLASYWKDGCVHFIPLNSDGDVMLPSVVSVDTAGMESVGNREHIGVDGEHTYTSFKRFMGTEKIYENGNHAYSPIDLSAIVLHEIKKSAQAYLGEEVSEAIISVPAYFNDKQRSDTKKAAKIAGLHVERLINEPSAAALAYRFHTNESIQNIMVFDFGGGTLDISMVECFHNIIEIVAIVGDNHLGGNDIDEAIAKYLCEQKQLDFCSLSREEQYKFMKLAEEIKCENSAQRIEKDKLLELCIPIFSKIKNLFYRIIKDAEYEISDIDAVVMVGGSSKLQIVQDFIEELFGKKPVLVESPDCCVAKGIGIYAGIRERKEDIKDIVLTDVSPFTLGTGVLNHEATGGRTHLFPMIERNSTLPASATHYFTTVHDYQPKICFKIYQGEEYYAEHNVLLGEIEIEVPLAMRGEESIMVTFNYDINGIIQVFVTNSRNETKEIMIANHELSEKELKNRLDNLNSIRGNLEEQRQIEQYIRRLQQIFEVEHGSDRLRIETMIEDIEKAMFSNRRAEKAREVEKVKNYICKWEKENEQLGYFGDRENN